jgi:hypothetical protein
LGPPGPLAWTLVARPGDGGLLTARAPGGTDGLCAWVTNDLGTDVLAPPVSEARAWVGLGTRADVVAR